jgi:uncharacterized membrane protein
MITVTLLTSPEHSEEERKIRGYLEKKAGQIPHSLVVIDIESDPSLGEEYKTRVPLLNVGPYHLSWPFSQQELDISLQAAHDRQVSLTESGDSTHATRRKRGSTFSNSDRFTLWFSSHYMFVFNLLVALYVGMAFLAPMLMKVGAQIPARAIYTLYSPLCHQLAYRSWFLFGEQSFYPREMAGIEGVITYNQATGYNDLDVIQAKKFIGNESLGYKVALCQRDIAIYVGILLFGIIYAISGRRIKSLPWYLWVLIGIVPMGIDGASQLPSLLTNLPQWLPLRESTPLLRTVTGLLFGITTAWYGYPLINESIMDSRRLLLQKRAIIEQVSSSQNDHL